MRLDSRAFGLAAGAMAAVLFTVCAFAVAVAPAWTTGLASALLHLDLSGMARTITWVSFFMGLACWAIVIGLTFAAVGGLYNRFHARTMLSRSSAAARQAA